MKHEETFPIRPYSHKELANHYGCSVKNLRRWLERLGKQLGPRVGHSYTPRQVRIIVKQLGMPHLKVRTGIIENT